MFYGVGPCSQRLHRGLAGARKAAMGGTAMKLSTLLSCIVFSLVPLAAQASPIISIGDGRATSWQDAINAGNILPVFGLLSDQACLSS